MVSLQSLYCDWQEIRLEADILLPHREGSCLKETRGASGASETVCALINSFTYNLLLLSLYLIGRDINEVLHDS